MAAARHDPTPPRSHHRHRTLIGPIAQLDLPSASQSAFPILPSSPAFEPPFAMQRSSALRPAPPPFQSDPIPFCPWCCLTCPRIMDTSEAPAAAFIGAHVVAAPTANAQPRSSWRTSSRAASSFEACQQHSHRCQGVRRQHSTTLQAIVGGSACKGIHAPCLHENFQN